MIIQFPNGAAIDSTVIASIHVVAAEKRGDLERPAQIVVYTFRESFGLDIFARSKPSASHFLSIPMPSESDANMECRKLVARWMGLPEPKEVVAVSEDGSNV